MENFLRVEVSDKVLTKKYRHQQNAVDQGTP